MVTQMSIQVDIQAYTGLQYFFESTTSMTNWPNLVPPAAVCKRAWLTWRRVPGPSIVVVSGRGKRKSAKHRSLLIKTY